MGEVGFEFSHSAEFQTEERPGTASSPQPTPLPFPDRTVRDLTPTCGLLALEEIGPGLETRVWAGVYLGKEFQGAASLGHGLEDGLGIPVGMFPWPHVLLTPRTRVESNKAGSFGLSLRVVLAVG